MEHDKVNQEQSVTTSTSDDKELVCDGVGDSKKLSHCDSQTETELHIPKEVDHLKIHESPKESTVPFDFSSVSASIDEMEKSLEIISNSNLHESAAISGIQINFLEELVASKNSETSAPSISQLDSSSIPDSNGVYKSGETTENSSFPEIPEVPSYFKPIFKMSDFVCGSSDAAFQDSSCHELHEQQSRKVKHENFVEGEIFVMELSDEESSSNHGKIIAKSSTSSTRTLDRHVDLSASERQEFLSDLTPTETLREEIFEPVNNWIPDYDQNCFDRPPFRRENFWPSMMRNRSGLRASPDSGNTSENSNDGTQEGLENLNQGHYVMFRSKNIAERAGEWMEIKKSDFGPYYEVSYAAISNAHIAEVLQRMKNNHYLASGNKEDLKIYGYCKYLLEKGTKVMVVNNEQGTLCESYPARIIIPYEFYIHGVGPRPQKELTIKSSGATCRDRFVAPAILFQQFSGCVPQFICRCEMLSVKESAEYETAKEVKVDTGSSTRKLKHIKIKSEPIHDGASKSVPVILLDMKEKENKEVKKYTNLGKILQITDLMDVDTKKFWISLNHIENIYEDFDTEFDIINLRFPGYEFFRQYHEAGRKAEGLLYGSDIGSDIVTITQNYIETIFVHFMREKRSMVIHCTSSCDQTSLFIALLRISLWADDLAHIALSAHEIVYLTLAYDWYFSGHNLPARLKHGEEIMHFCYNFLEYLLDDKFAPSTVQYSHRGYNAPFRAEESKKRRVRKLKYVRQLVLRLYDEYILKDSE